MRDRFRILHESGFFVMPNPWDVGSAKVLESLGFPALATTSSGHAASLGRNDQNVARDEIVEHSAALVAAIDVPLNVDSERCFAETLDGVAETVRLLAETGAAGFSIEDYDPATGEIDPIDKATERVEAAASVATESGMMLSARTENYLYGRADLADTIARLNAFAEVGADVLYAPGLTSIDDIATVVQEVDRPVNVLAMAATPPAPELAAVGVRRLSTGGALARAAIGGLMRAATELRDAGTSTYLADAIPGKDLSTIFNRP